MAIKRPPPVLHKSEHTEKVYNTLEQTVLQIQRAFDGTARITGLIAEKGAGKSHGVESHVLNNGAISISAGFWTTGEMAKRFHERNFPSVARWRSRRYRWEEVKEIPAEVRMANPFQGGNVCEDPERCDTFRPETLLFDWADFEIAGGLETLPEVIAMRQRFERFHPSYHLWQT